MSEPILLPTGLDAFNHIKAHGGFTLECRDDNRSPVLIFGAQRWNTKTERFEHVCLRKNNGKVRLEALATAMMSLTVLSNPHIVFEDVRYFWDHPERIELKLDQVSV